MSQEDVNFTSLDATIRGTLFLPDSAEPVPALIVCHGAGGWKEDMFEICEFLTGRGIAALALDMHGHGKSGGGRFYVDMREWVADIRAALDFLTTRPQIDTNRVGAWGISSVGTAILEAAMVEPRLKTVIGLDATVRNIMPLPLTLLLKTLGGIGTVKRKLTRKDLRISLVVAAKDVHLVSDPEINQKYLADPRFLESFKAYPFPGGLQSFFVDTLKRIDQIKTPTLILWGEEDKLDPPETARLIYAALKCEKELQIIPGNGHGGYADRNKAKVFELTADWTLKHLKN